MSQQLGNRGAGRTRFPSVNALSEFSHNQGHELSKWLTGYPARLPPLYPQNRASIRGLRQLVLCATSRLARGEREVAHISDGLDGRSDAW
jgi:hypothetical protein